MGISAKTSTIMVGKDDTMGLVQETRPDGTTIRGFTDPCDPNEDWARRYADWLCGMTDAEYHAQQAHDEECRRYEPNVSEFRERGPHRQLGFKVKRISTTVVRF